MLNSEYKPLCRVVLPYKERQRYMHSFDLANPVMAEGFEDYLKPVQLLCQAAGVVEGVAHMTVDEKVVQPGQSQRRPGPHVDGHFMPMLMSWQHGPGPGWNHFCNNVPVSRMPVIVAASAIGCRVWKGQFDTQPTDTGDLSHIADQLGDGELVPANVGYWLSPDCIHESMILDRPTKRSFLRIALPIA